MKLEEAMEALPEIKKRIRESERFMKRLQERGLGVDEIMIYISNGPGEGSWTYTLQDGSSDLAIGVNEDLEPKWVMSKL